MTIVPVVAMRFERLHFVRSVFHAVLAVVSGIIPANTVPSPASYLFAGSKPPSITLVSPVSGDTVFGGRVYLSAMTNASVAVAGVQFKLDGQLNIGREFTSAPYAMTWDTTSLSGPHTITAVVRDAEGHETASNSATVTVSAAGAAYLIPGDGFATATTLPGASGTGAASEETAIARWDVVPYQTITNSVNIGVVAFHVNGISKVSFSTNGGPWTDVMQMSRNPETGVIEYWATLRASDFPDGQIEVRAIAYPTDGVPRVLQGRKYQRNGEFSLFLTANSRGTIPSLVRYVSTTGNDATGDGTSERPFKSIYKAGMSINAAAGMADNGTVFLMAGDHSWADVGTAWMFPTTSYSWLTVTAAPGVDRSSVRITSAPSNGRIDTHLIHIRNLTMTTHGIQLLDRNTPALWYDACVIVGAGRHDGSVNFNWPGGSYATDTSVSGFQNALRNGTLVRNVQATHLGEDAFSDTSMVINSIASDIDPTGLHGPPHPDVAQFQNPEGNTVLYGVVAVSRMVGVQGLSGGGNRDMAIISCFVCTPGHQFYMDARQGGGILRHVLIKDCVFCGSGRLDWSLPFAYRPRTTAVNVVVDDSWVNEARTVPAKQRLGAYPGVIYRTTARRGKGGD